MQTNQAQRMECQQGSQLVEFSSELQNKEERAPKYCLDLFRNVCVWGGVYLHVHTDV